MPLPVMLSVEDIQTRLKSIFPEGTSHRGYVVREIAAKTVFTMLYIGAIEGSERWLGPKHVYRMSDTQAEKQDSKQREAFNTAALKSGFRPHRDRWYNDNSREPIRDETLKEGLMAVGAVTARTDLPTTSSHPRYALRAAFAELFNPELNGDALAAKITDWQTKHLSPDALARLEIIRQGRTSSANAVTITLPSNESRNMQAGESSKITKSVIEVFARKFLLQPAVIWLSESGKKMIERDDDLAKKIGLDIQPDRTLPDIILADVSDPMLLIFVEVVASDGPINESRRTALLQVARESKIPEGRVMFLTAFMDRNDIAFRKAVSHLAWGSFAWLASEPEHIIAMDGVQPQGVSTLRDFLDV
jgi:hypothetical protein